MEVTHDLVTHVLIISLLFYIAIAIHFLTLKTKKNETQKRQKRQPKKVLHSKPGWYQTVIDDQLPFSESLTESEKQKLKDGL
ncbi:MAG: hypothetical protein [Arizlama microvirus]|nr:MAG: hypothetical protein [Arizlama microvirus]